MTPIVDRSLRHHDPLRVLIVDDSAVYRRALQRILERLDHVEVVGTASSGDEALSLAEQLRPDWMTLDMEMPGKNGLAVLAAMQSWPRKPAVLVLSSHTLRGGELTIQALEQGAMDFLTKPSHASMEESFRWLETMLGLAVVEVRSILRSRREPSPRLAAPALPASLPKIARPGRKTFRAVAIGVSTGGPTALGRLLPHFPKDFPLPILIVQHMPPLFTDALAQSLSSKCALPVREAQDRTLAEPGVITIAPGGKHLKIRRTPQDSIELQLSEDPPEHFCRPAVDYLFRSVALQLAGSAIGVVLTGMGRDGAAGLLQMQRSGSWTIAQDEASSLIFGMPKEAISLGAAQEVLSLDDIAPRILELSAPLSRT